MLEIRQLGLERVVELIPNRFGDNRGYFCETYNFQRYCELGITEQFVQDNHSLSVSKGTLRGLHFQANPMAQAKLVRAVRGKIFDVAVDIRPISKTFGQWVGVELTAEIGNQLFIPRGFAHGFVTLEANSEVVYKADNYYAPKFDGSIRFDDPDIAIEWPSIGENFQLSQKDKNAPFLKNLHACNEWRKP